MHTDKSWPILAQYPMVLTLAGLLQAVQAQAAAARGGRAGRRLI